MRPIFRIEPKLPVEAMQTYAIARPRGTHTRPATCAEVSCPAHLHGWVKLVDLGTELGRKQSWYIRTQAGRAFTQVTVGTAQTFTFPAGQRCFAQHTVPLDRPSLFVKVGGDWRARTTPPLRMREVDWLDDFANHQDQLSEAQRRG